MTRLVVGIDAGATTTRCALVDESGRLLGSGTAPGANHNSSADASAALRTALAATLGSRRRVDALVLGAAGAGRAGQPQAEQAMRAVAAELGLEIAVLTVCSDVEIAFASGSAEPHGTVLIAGTGAVAARIADFAVAARADGHGYRLGDRGSAVWVGSAALRAVLGDIERTGPRTALRRAVMAHVGSDGTGSDDTQAILAAVYSQPPAWLGTVAPLVESCAADGDAVALAIVEAAVVALVATTRALASPGGALVVAGAIAAGDGHLGQRVRAALMADLGMPPIVARDTRVGGVALALRAVTPPLPDVANRLVRDGLR